MSGKKKMNNNKELLNELKVYCPTHKHKDLDALVRKLKGDRQKIDEQIQQWWDEPAPSSASQEVWEDVNRRNKKTNDKDATASNKKSSTAEGAGTGVAGGRGHSGSRSGERSGGRGGFARGMGGGRGAGPDARKSHRGRGDTATATSGGASKSASAAPVPVEKKHGAVAAAVASSSSSAPIVSQPSIPQTARPLQGAWGARAAAAAAPLVSAPASEPVVEEPVVAFAQEPVQEDNTPEILYAKDEEVEEEEHPTPAGTLGSKSTPAPKPTPTPATSGGNVWATKGSAHLIQAEKKPPVVSVEKKIKKVEEPRISMPVHISPAVSFDNSGLAASVNGSNVNASGWNPTHDVVESSSLMESTSSPIKEPVAAPEPAPAIVETTTTTTTTTSLKPTSVLNMGHWETGEGEESASHDFGFGSFGQENDIASVDETASSEPVNVSSTVSPARPPPGLGIGMPPMPEKIVHVHELENNIKNTTLASKEESTAKKVETMPDNFNVNNNIQAAHIGHHDGFASHYGMSSYGQYPMYNYSAQMGVPGNMVPPQQQPKQQNLGAQTNAYGAPVSGNVAESASVDSNAPSNPTGMPPGMMPQYNPALFYGQQNYQMGQPPGAYGYGFGTPYGGVQGYGFQQVMGQGGGYGQPYDDQAQHHSGNTHQGGYNKNTGGGYRGRNNHYQNQYNPGGYGSQPYNMGYNAYNEQRGGYLGNMDPYMNSGVYHQEGDQGKGKPKGNRNFGNQQQYQGGPQGTNQFGAGLQGAGAASTNTNSGNSGLYNQGGWSGGL